MKCGKHAVTNQMPFEPWFKAAFEKRTVHNLTTNHPVIQTYIDEAKAIEKIKNAVAYAKAKDDFLFKMRRKDREHLRLIWGDWRSD